MNVIADLPFVLREILKSKSKTVYNDSETIVLSREVVENIIEELERQQTEIGFYAEDVNNLMDEIDRINSYVKDNL